MRPVLQTLLWTLMILAAWEVAGRVLGFSPDILPTPSRILLEWIRESERLQAHGVITAAEVLGAFILSLTCAVPAAIALALVPSLRRTALPVISALHKAPLIAAAPLAFVWFGFGFRSIMLLAYLLSFLALTPGFVRGLDSLSEASRDLARLAQVGVLHEFLKLRLPSSLPCSFAAMKSAIVLVVGVVTVGEFVDGQKGLGYLMLAAAFKMETSLVFASLFAIMLIGLLLYAAIALAEFLLVPWNRSIAGPASMKPR